MYCTIEGILDWLLMIDTLRLMFVDKLTCLIGVTQRAIDPRHGHQEMSSKPNRQSTHSSSNINGCPSMKQTNQHVLCTYWHIHLKHGLHNMKRWGARGLDDFEWGPKGGTSHIFGRGVQNEMKKWTQSDISFCKNEVSKRSKNNKKGFDKIENQGGTKCFKIMKCQFFYEILDRF